MYTEIKAPYSIPALKLPIKKNQSPAEKETARINALTPINPISETQRANPPLFYCGLLGKT